MLAVKEREKEIRKDEILRVSLFDAVKLITEGRRGLSMEQTEEQQRKDRDHLFRRLDAYFVDYNFMGLLVQQNYLKVMQGSFAQAKIKNDSAQQVDVLERMSDAADSTSKWRRNNWDHKNEKRILRGC